MSRKKGFAPFFSYFIYERKTIINIHIKMTFYNDQYNVIGPNFVTRYRYQEFHYLISILAKRNFHTYVYYVILLFHGIDNQ